MQVLRYGVLGVRMRDGQILRVSVVAKPCQRNLELIPERFQPCVEGCKLFFVVVRMLMIGQRVAELFVRVVLDLGCFG